MSKFKKAIATFLSILMVVQLCSIGVFAAPSTDTLSLETVFSEALLEDENLPDCVEKLETRAYYAMDGTFVEKVEFEENGEYAAVIKRTYKDGSFDVTSINGDESITFEGVTSCVQRSPDSAFSFYSPSKEASIRDVTYPRYTPYWLAGYDDYSQNGVALTVAVIAGLIVANTGLGAGAATTIAGAIYTALGSNIYSNVYFRTYRYYALYEQAAGLAIWYNKFVTYTYSDANRTNVLTGPDTRVYESLSPM